MTSCGNCIRGLTDKKEVCEECTGTGLIQETEQEATVEAPIKKVTKKK